jgi:hypothetical protein
MNNMKRLAFGLFIGVLIGLLLMLILYNPGTANEGAVSESQEVTIRVSDCKKIGTRYLGYCGMLNNEVFSLSHSYNGAVNYYYPANSKQIYFLRYFFEVVSVDPNQITLRPVKKGE